MSEKHMARRGGRRFLIYPTLQLRMLLANVFVTLGAGGAIAFFVHRSFLDLINQGVAAKLPAQNPYFTFMAYQEKIVMTYIGSGLAIATLLTSFAILLFSHRVAGPIVRMSGFLDRVAGSPADEIREPPKLEFRKGDFFGDLPDKVNAALQACASAQHKSDPASKAN